MINYPVGGQVLSAVAGGMISVIGSVIIIAVVTWVVVVFRMSIFQVYKRWAWARQLIAIFVLVGSAGPGFDTSITSTGNTETINGNRSSFLSLCLPSSVAWVPAAADYFVYYPPSTQKWKTFLMTFTGIGLSLSFANLIAVGLASDTFSNTSGKTPTTYPPER